MKNLHITVGGMKRWGERASFVSTDTKVDAWYNAQISTSPPMFYYRVLCGVVYSVSIENTFDNPIRISSIIESDNFPSRFTNLSCETERT